MKLAKPIGYSDDARHLIERETYLTHCRNIANIIATSAPAKQNVRQQLVDLYITTVNTEVEA